MNKKHRVSINRGGRNDTEIKVEQKRGGNKAFIYL